MDEQELRRLIDSVKTGTLSRRDFLRIAAAFGLTAPVAAHLLTSSGIAQAQTGFVYKPNRRGGGGALRLLYWQAPTLPNAHFGVGTKDQEAARIFYEPLAAWDGEGNLVPILADGIPSVENGLLARDGKSVTWKLKRGVQWHDGKPFTADDCVFTWQYSADPATSTFTTGSYRDIEVIRVDSHTIRVEFGKPTPLWADPFVNFFGHVLPKHLFEPYKGAKSREAPANLRPVGTGPYQFVDFKPGDMLRARINMNYHQPNRPHFDTLELKGGGDAVSAARAVMQTGEFDFGWNLLVEDEILRRLESGGKGRAVITLGGDTESLWLNHADPWTEMDGERSNPKSRHPIFSDPAVREAMSLLVDRESIQKHIYGRAGIVTPNFLNNPAHLNSQNTSAEFSVAKANAVLDDAGWKRGADGVRAKDGKKLKFVFQTSINQPRQKAQAIIKQACQQAGVDIELKAVMASVFFSSDVANPDTISKFYADLQMYQNTRGSPDPGRFLELFCSWQMASRENKWQGRNLPRWRSDEYDRTYRAQETELDPVRRAALLIKLNDLVCKSRVVIPIVNRPNVVGIANKLRASFSAWGGDLWALQDWYREA